MQSELKRLREEMFSLFKKRQDKYLEKLKKITREINIMGPLVEAKSNLDIKERVCTLRNIIQKEIRKNTKNYINKLEKDILVEGIASLREISKRNIGERPYDEQIWAGIALFEGYIIEMRNGEGKTLAATMPLFLESLKGKSAHVATANDYLAKRDGNWMGPIYHGLGLSVGALQEDTVLISESKLDEFKLIEYDLDNKKQAYNCDIVYGKADRFAFDYLRDNLVFNVEDICQVKGLNFIIIDEVDCVLIDQARIPVILSQPCKSEIEKIFITKRIAERLNKGKDYTVNEKKWRVEINDEGIKMIENFLNIPNIYDPKLLEDKIYRGILPAINTAIKAKELYKENKDYIIADNNIVIIDEITGRPLFGRTYSDGLHQALEVKHGIEASEETIKIAEISLQKFFQKYDKIAGMTGTAIFDRIEYKSVYGKEVIVIPSRFGLKRIDKSDVIYRTKKERLDRVITEIENAYKKKQPILVNTLSVEIADEIAIKLAEKSIRYELLHAKNHQREAEIIKKAGQVGAVTIAAKMAGRGTDIKLEDEAEELGGLFVIGLERNESNRLDEQLKGRAGRHGKIGSSQFFLSVEDELLRLFGAEVIGNVLEKLGFGEGVYICHPMVDKTIIRIQEKVNSHNFDIRKNLLEFDDVLDKHRSNIYSLRKNILETHNLFDEISTIFDNTIYRVLKHISTSNKLKKTHISKFVNFIKYIVDDDISNPFEQYEKICKSELIKWAKNVLISYYTKQELENKKEIFEASIRHILLGAFNEFWKMHLENLDSLKSKMSMRTHTQYDLLNWYISESDKILDELISRMEFWFIETIFRVRVVRKSNTENDV